MAQNPRKQKGQGKLSANGPLPARFGRASASPNLAEAEREKRVARPDERPDSRIPIPSAKSAGRVLAAGFIPPISIISLYPRRTPGGRGADTKSLNPYMHIEGFQ